jgi:hypothetical protein
MLLQRNLFTSQSEARDITRSLLDRSKQTVSNDIIKPKKEDPYGVIKEVNHSATKVRFQVVIPAHAQTSHEFLPALKDRKTAESKASDSSRSLENKEYTAETLKRVRLAERLNKSFYSASSFNNKISYSIPTQPRTTGDFLKVDKSVKPD